MPARRTGPIREAKTVVFVAGEEYEILCRIAHRSNLKMAGAVRALIHLHAEDTLYVQQSVEVHTTVRAEKP